jgi:GGDEF domain-containing protein
MCTIAHAIRQNVARPDLVGRLAGTTFAVLLPKTGSGGANVVLEICTMLLKEERRKYSHPLNFYISAIACTKTPRTSPALMQEADSQMTR